MRPAGTQQHARQPFTRPECPQTLQSAKTLLSPLRNGVTGRFVPLGFGLLLLAQRVLVTWWAHSRASGDSRAAGTAISCATCPGWHREGDIATATGFAGSAHGIPWRCSHSGGTRRSWQHSHEAAFSHSGGRDFPRFKPQ